MKTSTTIISALSAAILMISCSNATAKTEKKTDEKSKAVTELSEQEFNTKVYDTTSEARKYLGNLPAIVDFTAVWCGPCQKTAPILEEIAKEYAGKVVVYKVDVDKCRKIANAMNISSIPAILYIPSDGGEAVMTVGARGKERFRSEIATFLLK